MAPLGSSHTPVDKKAAPLLDPTTHAVAPTTFKTDYQSTRDDNHNVAVVAADADSLIDSETGDAHRTTVWETFFHLIKGYIGVGLLSLPWAITQLGILGGCVAIFVMSAWSSYNCWTVVRVKRYIEHQRNRVPDVAVSTHPSSTPNSPMVTSRHNNNNNGGSADNEVFDDEDAASTATTNTNITYPDLGEWAYGKTFQKYVSACICTQQLAICTVFISFIGENLNALLKESSIDFGFWETHVGVMTVALPCCLSLSFIPSLKGLAPVMAAGSVLVVVTLVLLGIVGGKEWSDRPTSDELPTMDIPSAPLAMCAILYSYEGICLILPIESAMQQPKHFAKTFTSAMAVVALVMAVFGCFCVYAFGQVNNGSITAFLLHHYQNEPSLAWWLRCANTTISLSVLLTYPLQLFPAVEILGPSFSQYMGERDFQEEEREMDRMPALPEHDEYQHIDDVDQEENNNANGTSSNGNNAAAESTDSSLRGMLRRASSSLGLDPDDAASFVMEFPNQMMPKMILPGDSPQLRACLVLLTYTIAVVVPNVESLISLAGALAGSSSALIIPPVLELAWLQHLSTGSGSDEIDASSPAPPASIGRSPEPRSHVPFADRTSADSPPSSPILQRMPRSSKPVRQPTWLLFSKIKCYLLIGAGMVFLLLGTYDALSDIIAIYSGEKED